MHPAPGRVSSQAEAREQEGLSGTVRTGLGDSGLTQDQVSDHSRCLVSSAGQLFS